jgi:glyoxylase-like metal-dependent hydrolase (beta-lactamase superfamily II)
MVAVIRDEAIDGATVIPCRLNGPRGIVKSILFHDDSSAVLVDTGFNEADAVLITQALRRLGRSLSDLTMCVITHHHLDHVGGLKALRAQGSFPLVSHELDAAGIAKTSGVSVDRTVQDGEIIAAAGGIRVVHMPGHTPGSIALYHEGSRSLAAGDAIFSAGEWLIVSPSYLCEDPDQARESVRRLLELDLPIERVLVAHGEDVYSGAPAQLSKILMRSRADWG